MQPITKSDCEKLVSAVRGATTLIKQLKDIYRPAFNGERYLTNAEVCSLLKISSRTLQEYRDTGLLPYVTLPGKILYRESDLIRVLEENYVPSLTQIQDTVKWKL